MMTSVPTLRFGKDKVYQLDGGDNPAKRWFMFKPFQDGVYGLCGDRRRFDDVNFPGGTRGEGMKAVPIPGGESALRMQDNAPISNQPEAGDYFLCDLPGKRDALLKIFDIVDDVTTDLPYYEARAQVVPDGLKGLEKELGHKPVYA